MTPFRAQITGWSILESMPPKLLLNLQLASPAISISQTQVTAEGNKINVHLTTRDSGKIAAAVLVDTASEVSLPSEMVKSGTMIEMYVDGECQKTHAIP